MKGKKITNILDFLHTMRNRIKPFSFVEFCAAYTSTQRKIIQRVTDLKGNLCHM